MNIIDEIKMKGKEDPWFSINEIVKKGLLDGILGKTTWYKVMCLIGQNSLKAERVGGQSRKFYKSKASWIKECLEGGKNGI